MKLTACWIVKDEENVIARSIKSVKKAVDEMIVVDTGSADDTVNIAEAQGARVLRFDWIGDFSAAKNFALEQAERGYVIFLDADEYLEPPLGPAQKKLIQNAFGEYPNIDVLSIRREDINSATGDVFSTGINNRILRHNGHVNFKNKIHEEMVRDGGRPLVLELDLVMKHTGYSGEVMESKLQRNIAMLEDTLKNEAETFNGFMNRLYLMREYQEHDPERSFENWKIVAPQTDNWLYGATRYKDDFFSFLIRAILVAGRHRGRVSRKYVYQKLSVLVKKEYAQFALAPLTDHIYMQLFDMRDDRFMERFDEAMAEAEKAPNKDRFYREEEMIKALYGIAALAMWKRGETRRAMTYASKALFTKEIGDAQAQMIHIILDGLAGKDPVDIAQALSGIYRRDDWTRQRFLLKQLMREDMRAIYPFFLKQLIGSGQHTLDEYLYYVLITGGLEQAMGEAQKAFAQSQDEKTFESVGALLFVAATALEIEPIYRGNPQGLSGYARILDAYFGGEALEEIRQDEFAALRTYYPYIAFLGGSRAAERYLRVFSKDQRSCFFVKQEYAMRNRQYKAICEADISEIREDDWNVYSCVIAGAIFAGEYALALEHTKRFLKKQITGELLDFLLLIAERGGGAVKAEARGLYDGNMGAYEDMIDLNDMIVTGIVADERDRKAERMFADMSVRAFDEWMDRERDAFAVELQLSLRRQAADVYRAKRYIVQYGHSLMKLVAHGYHKEENAKELGALFTELGNAGLAGRCDELAAE